jgi:hypothetical protein
METDEGLTKREKSGGVAEVTFSVALVVCVSVPLLPEMVRVKPPTGVEDEAVTVSVDEEVAGLGLKLAVAPAGRPALTLNVTEPVKPFCAAMVTA